MKHLNLHILNVTLPVSGIAAILAACTQLPDCRVNPEFAEQAQANAGCLVRDGDYLLAVEQKDGRLSFPGGQNEDGETAQCTAHRETWEETGLAVEVGQLLHVFDNGFRLYACQPVDAGIRAGHALAPSWWVAWREIEAVHWLNPDSIEATGWRYPQQWPRVLEIFQAPQ